MLYSDALCITVRHEPLPMHHTAPLIPDVMCHTTFPPLPSTRSTLPPPQPATIYTTNHKIYTTTSNYKIYTTTTSYRIYTTTTNYKIYTITMSYRIYTNTSYKIYTTIPSYKIYTSTYIFPQNKGGKISTVTGKK